MIITRSMIILATLMIWYALMGLITLINEIQSKTEDECKREMWSPLHPVIHLLLWPYFLIRRFF